MLLRGHKSLEPWCHPKAQLLDERRLRLTVDLNFHSCFKRRFLWKSKKKQSRESETSVIES